MSIYPSIGEKNCHKNIDRGLASKLTFLQIRPGNSWLAIFKTFPLCNTGEGYSFSAGILEFMIVCCAHVSDETFCVSVFNFEFWFEKSVLIFPFPFSVPEDSITSCSWSWSWSNMPTSHWERGKHRCSRLGELYSLSDTTKGNKAINLCDQWGLNNIRL